MSKRMLMIVETEERPHTLSLMFVVHGRAAAESSLFWRLFWLFWLHNFANKTRYKAESDDSFRQPLRPINTFSYLRQGIQ